MTDTKTLKFWGKALVMQLTYRMGEVRSNCKTINIPGLCILWRVPKEQWNATSPYIAEPEGYTVNCPPLPNYWLTIHRIRQQHPFTEDYIVSFYCEQTLEDRFLIIRKEPK